jgi:hypothetical protein
LHQHFFTDGVTLPINGGDVLFCYVYLDPSSLPQQMELQWLADDGTSWGHRAWWGSQDLIGWSPSSQRGPIPAAGQWVRLEVPASAVGLEGKTVKGMAFTLYGGSATWDYAGKCSCGSPPTPPSITVQPQSQTVAQGSPVTFSVIATGTAPLSYQWQKNGSDISGATGNSHSLPAAQLSDAGTYRVIVHNDGGTTPSADAILTVTPASSCLVPPTDLVSWWRAEATPADEMGQNNGTFSGTYATAKVGQGLYYDGGGTRTLDVDVIASSSMDVGKGNGLTFEAWIYPADTGYHPVFEWGSSSGTGVHLWINFVSAGRLFANVYDTAGASHFLEPVSPVISPNTWHHVALTYDKSSGLGRLFINGTQLIEQNLGVFTPQTTHDFHLGHRVDGLDLGPISFKGLIDEASVYNRALSPIEIQAIFIAGSAGKCPQVQVPVITSQPQSLILNQGAQAAFSVTATGATSYQWYFNGVAISGATGSLYTKANVQASDAGNYTVAVTGPGGTVMSATASVTVITSQPMSQTVYTDDIVTFSVTAAGSSLSYQWRKGSQDIAGATEPSFTIPWVQLGDAGQYSVRVASSGGTATSANAILTVQSRTGDAVVLTGSRQDYKLRNDQTYYVASPVRLVSSSTPIIVEGGAIVNYAKGVNAKLIFDGPVEFRTDTYLPAIFTADLDDSVGVIITEAQGELSGSFAAVALEFASSLNTTVQNVQIRYAGTALQFDEPTTSGASDIVRHAQITHCLIGCSSKGTSAYPRILKLANALLTDVGQPISGSYFSGRAEHMTVDGCADKLVWDAGSSAADFVLVNSIVANTSAWGQGLNQAGSANNGFFGLAAGLSPFGAYPTSLGQSPFASEGPGEHYLNDATALHGKGTVEIDPALLGELKNRTTYAPVALPEGLTVTGELVLSLAPRVIVLVSRIWATTTPL